MFFRPSVLVLATVSITVSACAQTVKGRVGETKHVSVVYAGPSSRSHALYRIEAGERLYLQNTGASFVPLLLNNGRFAYVRTKDVEFLPYTWSTTLNPGSLRSAPLLSRGSTAIAEYGMRFAGTPYKWGGTNLETGIDCSGFVQKLFGEVAGIELPRTAAEQALVGEPITRLEELRPGDRLYFWEAKRHMIGHTGIYVGNGYFVHSSSGNHGVATEALTRKWLKILVAARR